MDTVIAITTWSKEIVTNDSRDQIPALKTVLITDNILELVNISAYCELARPNQGINIAGTGDVIIAERR